MYIIRTISQYISIKYYMALYLCVSICFLSVSPICIGQEQIEIVKGTTLRVVAPLSTNQQILGVAFDKNFNSIDATGNKYNAFSKGKIVTTKNVEYKASYKEIDDASQMRANIGFSQLFSVSTQKVKRTRYAVLSVYLITKTETFQPEGLPTVNADFFAHQIHYGWAIHYIISEDISKFNAETSSAITKIVSGIGGELDYKINELRLSKELVIRGLKPKQDGSVVLNPRDIGSTFVQVGKEAPIFIEFKTLTNVPVEAISWEAPKVVPGKYILESIDYSINSKKENGKNWDVNLVGSTDPDASIEVKINGNFLDKSAGNTNALRGSVVFNKPFELNEQTIISIEVVDIDGMSGHDFVGKASISFKELSSENIESLINVHNKTGKIDDLKIQLKRMK